jgi:hypothetical protein
MERFIGTWHLVSFDHVHPDGHTTYPGGHRPHGKLTFTADGRMQIAIEGLPSVPQNPAALPLAYTGRYEVTETHVIHHIETSSRPDWIGSTFRRNYAFARGRLILSVDDAPVSGRTSLVWEQDESAS